MLLIMLLGLAVLIQPGTGVPVKTCQAVDCDQIGHVWTVPALIVQDVYMYTYSLNEH